MAKPIITKATAYDTAKEALITPIPGAVWRDRKWKVKAVDQGGSTLAKNAYMEADGHDTDRGAYTRAHEMLHTVYSPEDIPSANKDAYIVLEETQIANLMPRVLDLPPEAYVQAEADKERVFQNALPNLDKMPRRMRAMLAVAVGDTLKGPDIKRINELLPSEKDAKALIELMRHCINSVDESGYSKYEHNIQVEMAARFDLMFNTEEPDEKPDDEDEDEGKGKGKSKGEDEDEGEDEDGDLDEDDDDSDEEIKPEHKPKPKEDFKRTDVEAAKWENMVTEHPPLVHASKALRLLQKRVPRDTGSHITRLTRIVSDGFIFGDKKRVQGGTVLVDTSGSMSITGEDMRNLLDQAPAATVASYGQNHHYGNRDGTLRIIVSKGRMAAEEDLAVGGGNGVDGPALEWLATMPEPRYWVSDGYVIGSNGSGKEHINFCAKVCKNARIVRLNDIPEAVARLTGKPQVKK